VTRPPTIDQLRNLTDRASHGLTADEQARLREGLDRLAEYENTINWMTTCTGCARVLDSCIRETQRAERAEAAADRVRDLADRWVKAGPPPLGTHLARWWDKRLIELNTVLNEPASAATQATDTTQPGPA
jgi:hypothetical protein